MPSPDGIGATPTGFASNHENKPSQGHTHNGGAKGTRTPDLLVANETRYQLRHSPAETGRADQHRDFTTSGGGGLLRFCKLLVGLRNRLHLRERRRVCRHR